MRPGIDPWVGKILWRRAWLPTPVLLPGESHGQRSLRSDQIRSVAQSCPTACDPMGCTLLLSSWDFPGRSTGVSCHFLLQRIFPTQGSISGLLHYRQKLYHLSHQGMFSPASLSPSNFGLKSSKITRGYSDR